MTLDERTRRKIAAVIFSLLVNVGIFLLTYATQKPGRDESLEMILAVGLGIIGSSLILGRRDGFLKTFLFCCFAAFLPTFLLILIAAVRYDHSFGAVMFSAILFGILLTVATVISLPWVALIYWWGGKRVP